MTQRSRPARLTVLVTSILVAATACTSSGSPKAAKSPSQSGTGTSATSNLSFVLIRHGLPSDSFWAPVQKGFTDGGSVYGIKTNFVATGNTPNDEAKAIDAAVAQKVSGIVVTLPDAGAEGSAIKRATAAGIPVITTNSGASDWQKVGALTHVGQDEGIAGAGAATKLKAGGAKHLLCVEHQQGNIGLDARCNGAKKTFGGRVDVQFVPGTSDGPGTEAALKAKLQQDSSIDAVLTLDPDISVFAKNAITGSNSKAKLATFDLSSSVLSSIKNGSVQFAVNQQPYVQGYLPVTLLKLYLDNGNIIGGGLPVLTGPSYVDKSNVDKTIACVKAGRC